MNGGLNARERQIAEPTKGWHYNHDSPWMKITADVHGGECNAFVGDCGNYDDRPDIMLAGNFHARSGCPMKSPCFS